MTNFDDIKGRLRILVKNRNYYFKDTTKREAEKYLKSKTDFIGLTEAEITGIEKKLGKSFPQDFKQYLLMFGKNCGDLFCCGQDIETEKFVDYQKWAYELINGQNIEQFFTEHSIVFIFHQGYSFFYFDKDGVYSYAEGDKTSKRIAENFSKLLQEEIEQLEKLNREGQETYGYFIIINGRTESMEFPAMNSGIRPREIGDQFVNRFNRMFN